MKSKILFGILFGYLMVACSSDDEGTTSEPIPPSPTSFIAIGENDTQVLQYSYDAEANAGMSTNLTETVGLPIGYLAIRQNDEVVSFYTFFQGAFNLYQWDTQQLQGMVFEQFYELTDERSVAWGTDLGNNVLFGYFGPFTARDLALQRVSLLGDVGTDVTIESSVASTSRPLTANERVYISYVDSEQDHKLVVYDWTTEELSVILNFGKQPFSFFVTENDEVAVLKNEVPPVMELYDAANLDFLNRMTLSTNLRFDSGPVNDVVLLDNKVYYNFTFAQPSTLTSGPAIYDLDSGDNVVFPLDNIVDEVEQQVEQSIGITTQVYDKVNNVFLVGFGALDATNRGGVFQLSEAGELIEVFEFPFTPTYLVRN